MLNVILKMQWNTHNNTHSIDIYTIDCYQSCFLLYFTAAVLFNILVGVTLNLSSFLYVVIACFAISFLIQTSFNETIGNSRLQFVKQCQEISLKKMNEQSNNNNNNNDNNINAFEIEKQTQNNDCFDKIKKQWNKHQTLIQIILR